MRKGDIFAGLYFFGLLTLVLAVIPVQFTSATKTYPYIMGFLKVSLLATFGEFLKKRISEGKWKWDGIFDFIIRFFIWGLYGMWFTTIFALFSMGVDQCVMKNLWPNGNFIWIAFSKSFWINILGGYGWFMMLSHEWFNQCIKDKKRVSLVVFSESIDKKIWFGKIPATILYFWLPAHTVTFALPGEYRVLSAAILSVVLGFLLTPRKVESK